METAPTVLFVGAGHDKGGEEWGGYQITRLDVDPATSPDVLAPMTAMGEIGPFDAVYCSHSLEHVYPHEVPIALAEMYRVLKPGGRAVILVPDLEGVSPDAHELPDAPGLCGLHLFYGDARLIPEHPYMAHHCGFIAETLKDAMEAAGFIVQTSRMSYYNLMGIGIK